MAIHRRASASPVDKHVKPEPKAIAWLFCGCCASSHAQAAFVYNVRFTSTAKRGEPKEEERRAQVTLGSTMTLGHSLPHLADGDSELNLVP